MRLPFLLFAASLITGAAASAQAQTIAVKVTASAADCVETPLSIDVPVSRMDGGRAPAGAVRTLCQAQSVAGGKVRLTFIVRGLKRGESRVLALSPAVTIPEKGVTVSLAGKDAEVRIDGALFTRYDVSTGPTKPYLYPIIAFGGKHLTRRWPVENADGEAKDHPHHRGLWFTHGAMNGIDFWTEEVAKTPDKVGKTVHTGFSAVESGPVQGRFVAATDWVAPGNKIVARDTRDIRVTPVDGGVLLDFSVTITAVGGPLTWGDTKEGTFAIRVPETMKADKPGDGTLVNAEGLAGAALWGKASAWNDYFGTVDGATLGMAIFDNPQNPRYPTTWHSRTYGLFAANPFGLHDFDPAKKNDHHAGDLVTPAGQSTTFRYRVFFHTGDTKAAKVASRFADWATPPTVELLGANR